MNYCGCEFGPNCLKDKALVNVLHLFKISKQPANWFAGNDIIEKILELRGADAVGWVHK